MATKRGWAEFWQFVKDVRSPLAWIAKAAIVIPVLTPYAPPWPAAIFVNVLAAMFQGIVVALAFIFWRGDAIEKARPAMVIAPAFIGVALLVYLFLWSKYVVVFPDEQWYAEVVGCALYPDWEQLRQSNPSFFTNEVLLDRSGRKPESAWTPGCLAATRISLIVTWLVFWLATFVFLAAFTVNFQRRPANAPPMSQSGARQTPKKSRNK